MTDLLATMLLPPLSILLIAGAGMTIHRWWPRTGRWLLYLSLAGAYFLSTPAITGPCLRYLENVGRSGAQHIARTASQYEGAVIVVLGSGSYFNAPEYGSDTVSSATLVRLRWAAHLHRDLKLPVLVSGGSPYDRSSTEAEQMRVVLEADWGVPVKWMDARSRDTWESAFNVRDLLIQQEGINQIVLVTHASHMPRAAMMFEHAGFTIAAAPTAFTTKSPVSLLDFLPTESGMRMAATFLHEVMGIGWYHFRLWGSN